MKAQSRYAQSVWHVLAGTVLVTVATSAQGQVRADTEPATSVDEKVPKQRVADVQPRVTQTGLAPARVDRGFLLFDAAEAEIDPAELPVETVEVLDDATIARGRSRGLPVPQTPVYLQLDSCGRGHYFNNDYTYGLGTWFAQARFRCPPGFPLCRDHGWQPGGQITAYEVSKFHCSSSSANDCSVTVELWDGDPLGIMDTVCNPTPSPIAGTKTTFSGLSRDELHNLRAHLPTPVTCNCDRVWIAVSMIEGCRGSWLLGGWPPYYCGEDAADIGWGDGYGANWGCQAYGYCATPSYYNSGFCCTTGEACDYTDSDPNNWTGDCQEGGAWPPDCPDHCWGFFTHPTFCSDGLADNYFYAYDLAPYGYYYAQPGAVYAAADKYIALVPVSADAPPDQNLTPNGWRISGNEIILADPGRPVWLELRVGDWDPDGTGTTLKAWQAYVETSGFSSGSEGALMLPEVWCTTDAPCESAFGRGSSCGCPGWQPYTCCPAFIDRSRTDYIFSSVAATGNTCFWEDSVCYGGTLLSGDGIPSPGYETYGGTLALEVPPSARGRFTINFSPYPSLLIDGEGALIPLVGFIPAKITIGGSLVDPLVPKNRYLSFAPGAPGTETALRVTFKDLPAPYDTWNGTSMWAAPPVEYCENSGQATPPAQGCGPAPGHWPTYWASTLQCDPHYRYWSTLGVVHMFHEGIIPGATYEIQSIETGHDISVEDNFSAPVEIRTSIWGDVVRDCATYPCSPPDGSVDVPTDITALVDKYRNVWGAVMQTRADLVHFSGAPGPDQRTFIIDVTHALDAFRGFAYPFSPGLPPCLP
ncbi:MAG: hypothetical protein JSU86_17180 [Phycisphaerales bacterium]|nr:MAG: hypothetical protein JSU86_17180 [Phycisphaerales bacterium]